MSSNNVPTDFNLIRLSQRREKLYAPHFYKLTFDMISSPFPSALLDCSKSLLLARCATTLTFRFHYSQNGQALLSFRRASSLWNSIQLEIKSPTSRSYFPIRLNS